MKMIGLRFHYFTVPWNIFDFLLVLASILGILMEDVMIDFPVSPTLLRVVRVFRIGRILRLIKVINYVISFSFSYGVRVFLIIENTCMIRRPPKVFVNFYSLWWSRYRRCLISEPY